VIELRDYQAASVERIRTLMLAGQRRICLVAPTGSGKGSTIAYMIHGAAVKGKRVLFLVAGRQLVDEFSQRLERQLGVAHGVLMAGHWRRQDEQPVQVASVDTLASYVRNQRALPPADLVILDEADLSVAERFASVLARYPQAFVIGMTATPVRADGKGLGRLFGELVVAATPAALIARGYLAPYDGVALVSRLSDEEVSRAGRSDDGAQSVWDALEDKRRSQIVGDCVQEWVAHVGIGSRRPDGQVRAAPAPTVGFAMTREHSREVVKAFNDARVHGAPVGVAIHIDGDTKLSERDRVHEAMRQGEIHVVSNVGVMGRGVDWPLLEACAFWRPTQSLALHLQMAGRVLRPHPGKVGAFYLDHVGNFARHGLPDDDRDWSLEDGEAPSRDVAKLEPTTTCWKCAAVFLSGRPCPRCGTVTQAKPRALPEKVAGEAVSIRDVKRELPEDVRMERALYALIAVGIAKGLPPSWGAGVGSRKWKQPMPDGAKVNRIAAQVRNRR